MSEIRAGTTTTTALTQSGDTSGNLILTADNNLNASSTGSITLTPGTGVAKVDSTGAFIVPVGTTEQRPSTPVIGMTRVNTTNNSYEVYSGLYWIDVSTFSYSIEYLLVAGGGSGGTGHGGGGGAGGYIANSINVTPLTTYTATIGAGGTAGIYNSTMGTAGVNSSFGVTSTAIGGGFGGGQNQPSNANRNGGNGGSGGGGGNTTSGSGAGGSNTSGQGNIGGTGSGGAAWAAAGGGGAGSAGSNNPDANTGGAGGAGLNWQSLGTFYAGGGGGCGGTSGTGAAGGSGGGGSGVPGGGTAGNGTANTGGGGGGARDNNGGNGGSGVLIIRYAGTQKGTGGTVTSSNGYTYHTFTTSGTFTA